MQRADALELLFEDGSDEPFSVIVVHEQTDRIIPETDQGSGITVALYTEHGLQLELPAKYRLVPELPCLAPWTEQ